MELSWKFLSILSDYLNEHTRSDNEGYPVEIEEFSQKHQLGAVVYYQTKIPALQVAYVSQISNYCNRLKAVERLNDSLRLIPHLFFKGDVIAKLYSQPALRSMGDVDVLIHESDRNAVHDKLVNAGFKLVRKTDIVWIYTINSIIFEVHTQLMHPSEGTEPLVSFFTDVWDHFDGEELEWNYHFIFLLAHLRHHISSEGAGFRQFMDIAIVSRKIEINWKYIWGQTEKLGLKQFLLTVLKLNEIWFGIRVKEELCLDFSLKDDFVERATQYIMANGVFGFDNPDNENSGIAKEAINQNKSVKSVVWKNIFKQLFPPYSVMINASYCRYLKKNKLLLPIAWLHRFFAKIWNKQSREALKERTIINSGVSDKKVKLLMEFGI